MKPSSAAVDASGMHAAATEAAPVKSATSSETATTSATPSIGIIWDQTCGEQNDYCKSSKYIAKHDK
jgi:hypothetical protein